MIKETGSRKIFVAVNYIFLTLLSITMLIPFLNLLAGSFSSSTAIIQGKVTIFPVGFSLLNYQAVLGDSAILRSFIILVSLLYKCLRHPDDNTCHSF